MCRRRARRVALVLLAGRACGLGLEQQPVVLDPETALGFLSANTANKDVDSTLVEFGLSENTDPMLQHASMSDPRYREAHGGRPGAPGGVDMGGGTDVSLEALKGKTPGV